MVKSSKIPNFMGHDDEVVEKKKICMKIMKESAITASQLTMTATEANNSDIGFHALCKCDHVGETNLIPYQG